MKSQIENLQNTDLRIYKKYSLTFLRICKISFFFMQGALNKVHGSTNVYILKPFEMKLFMAYKSLELLK